MKDKTPKSIALPLLLCLSVLSGSLFSQSASDVIVSAGLKGGLIVHLDCGSGAFTSGLLINDRYLVHGLDTDRSNVAGARKYIRSQNPYGKVSIDLYDGKNLPYADNLINLVVSNNPTEVSMDEIIRVLAPGGVAYIDGEKTVKPWPEDIDQWTHFLHEPDNNAVARDDKIGQPRSLHWMGGPRWARSHEELASMSAAVSSNGRLFYIMDAAPLASIRYESVWQLRARDAFNGIDLWKRNVANWVSRLRHFRAGPAHLARRLVASDDRVYVTLGLDAPVSELDAATGRTLRTFAETEHTEEIILNGGILYLVIGTSEVDVTGKGLHRLGSPDPADYRRIKAVDLSEGRELWTSNCESGGSILPLTLAVAEGRLFYYGIDGIVCLDSSNGEELWRTHRDTPGLRYSWSAPTLVAYDDVVLVADRDIVANDTAAKDEIRWNVDCMAVKGIPRPGQCSIRAYSVQDGKQLWTCPCREGYNSPVDVFVVDDVIWYGPRFNEGRDVHSGEVVKTFTRRPDGVGMVHDRCYRNKATSQFIMTGRSGVEFISYDRGWIGNNSWVRGTCQYGVLPCNGLLYVPPNACACFQRTKMQGMLALGARLNRLKASPKNTVLEKGPAFDAVSDMKSYPSETQAADEWHMYRCNSERSGYCSTTVSKPLTTKRSVDIGGRLTQPVFASNMVYVASIDEHTIYAISSNSGDKVWEYTAGGRIDSPPTIFDGTVLFGSADGWVYCLSAKDGTLAWRLRIAPEQRLICSFGQLESAWPAHGSVLVQNGKLYAAAGRVSYLDGGIYMYRIDPYCGKVLSTNQIHHIDPATNKQTGIERPGSFDMEGTLCDLLAGDGESVYLKHLRFDSSINKIDESEPHLFSTTGLLGEEWFIRSFWLVGVDISGGWPKWTNTKDMIARGRILSWNEDRIYGYGRELYAARQVGHRADNYHLFCSPNELAQSTANDNKKNRAARVSGSSRSFHWTKPDPLTVRAMALTKNHLIVAGLPIVAKKSASGLFYHNPNQAIRAFKGEKGALLRLYSSNDGTLDAEYELDAPPVFDGLIASKRCVYISLRNGCLVCLQGEEELAQAKK